MSGRKLLGALLLLLVAGGILVPIGLTDGWWDAVFVAVASLLIAAVTLAGVWLLTED